MPSTELRDARDRWSRSTVSPGVDPDTAFTSGWRSAMRWAAAIVRVHGMAEGLRRIKAEAGFLPDSNDISGFCGAVSSMVKERTPEPGRPGDPCVRVMSMDLGVSEGLHRWMVTMTVNGVVHTVRAILRGGEGPCSDEVARDLVGRILMHAHRVSGGDGK